LFWSIAIYYEINGWRYMHLIVIATRTFVLLIVVLENLNGCEIA